MKQATLLLLCAAAVLAWVATQPSSGAARVDGAPAIAQKFAQAGGRDDKEKDKKRPQKKGAPLQKRPPKPPAIQPRHQAQPPKPPAIQPRHQQAQPPKPPAIQPRHQAQPPKPPAIQPRQHQAQPPAPPQPQQSGNRLPLPSIQQPIKPHDASEYLRRNNQAPRQALQDVRRERTERRQGNRVVIHEGSRVIVRQDNRTIIHHNEDQRFAIGARDVRVKHRGDEIVTAIERPNGVSIITVTDPDGNVIRRVRRDPNGREIVLIDNAFHGARRNDYFIDVPPPVVRIPRDRYIVDAWRATPAEIYDTFIAPPVMYIEHPYTLDQVRFNHALRERMPRIDLDINFDTGSWQLTPHQIDRLGVIAEALNRAIQRNLREVFLVEGHTDAVGSEEDNLSLSDRRAEAVAVALTEQFGVPPENLVTQGYGEEYLKVPTQGPERANRRVAIRRITPLIDQAGR